MTKNRKAYSVDIQTRFWNAFARKPRTAICVDQRNEEHSISGIIYDNSHRTEEDAKNYTKYVTGFWKTWNAYTR
jgi:hypothetical protein